MPQAHTNYQVSMVLKALIRIVDNDDSADFLNPIPHEPVGNMTLLQVLLKHLKISDRHSLIAKIHQTDPQLKTTIIVPNKLEAECLIATMNKNVATFL